MNNEITPNKDIKKETLEEICKKVSDFIHENYNPHTSIVISDTHIKVVQDIQGIPVKRGNSNDSKMY